MPIETQIFKLDDRDPDLAALRDIARGCRSGKIVAFPTETVYGIGGPMSHKEVAAKLSAIKDRDPSKPFSYHIGDWGMIELLNVDRTRAFRYLTKRFWPGPLTLIVRDKSDHVIGLRYPKSRVTSILINTVGEPFVGTSANKAGMPSPKTAEDVLRGLGGEIDYLMDSGPSEFGEDSTIIDLTGNEPKVIRKGAQGDLMQESINEILTGKVKKKILVVCTGNSCRSPMAEGWIRNEAEHLGISDKIEVESRGIMPGGGRVATPEAVLIMKNREVDISNHQSKGCTREDVLDADIIIAMSQEHERFITGMIPEAKSKIWVLNIPDPIGMGILMYEEVIKNIEILLKERWNELVS